MIHGSLQKLGHIIRQLPMGLIIKPPQFRNSTHEFNQRSHDKVRQRRSLVGEVGQDIVPNVNALGDGEIVPVGGDEVREGVGGHEACVVRGRVVKDELTLGDAVGGGLER